MAQPKQTDPQFKLRLTPKLKEQIEISAAENNRSMNAEIVARLEHSFTDQTAALLEAASIAESLRANLTEKLVSIDKAQELFDLRMRRVAEREAALDERETGLSRGLDHLRETLEQEFEDRRKKQDRTYRTLMNEAKERFERADEYAAFTIARERQFIETIKALTGKEPPAVEPISKAARRGLNDDEGKNKDQ